MHPDQHALMYEVEANHWWYASLHELTLKLIQKYTRGKDLRIFDAGCGTGQLLTRLQSLGRCDGADRSPVAVSFCRQRGLSNVRAGDITEPFPEKTAYDVVTCMDVLNCLGDDERALAQIYDGLKPGGLAFINVPAFPSLLRGHDKRVSNLRRYRLESLRSKLQNAGMDVVFASYRWPLLFPLAWARAVLEKVRPMAADLRKSGPFLNLLMKPIVAVENGWLERGRRIPFGTSLYLVAKRNG